MAEMLATEQAATLQKRRRTLAPTRSSALPTQRGAGRAAGFIRTPDHRPSRPGQPCQPGSRGIRSASEPAPGHKAGESCHDPLAANRGSGRRRIPMRPSVTRRLMCDADPPGDARQLVQELGWRSAVAGLDATRIGGGAGAGGGWRSLALPGLGRPEVADSTRLLRPAR